MTPRTTRSPPLATALIVCEPPMSANWVSPASRLAMPLLPSTSWRSGSRPFWVKMPASFATHRGISLPLIWLKETVSFVGAGGAWPAPGPAGAPAPLAAAVGAAGGAPPAGADEPAAGWQATSTSRAAVSRQPARRRRLTSSNSVYLVDVDLEALLLR